MWQKNQGCNLQPLKFDPPWEIPVEIVWWLTICNEIEELSLRSWSIEWGCAAFSLYLPNSTTCCWLERLSSILTIKSFFALLKLTLVTSWSRFMKLLSCMPLSCQAQEPSSNSCIFCLAIFYSTGSMCDFYHHKLVIFWEKKEVKCFFFLHKIWPNARIGSKYFILHWDFNLERWILWLFFRSRKETTNQLILSKYE